ncbi:hypothetical protein K9M78_06410 [Candidatus Bipolaricaulota bacterium]|nr:hypothetical protein [Candidatus Bipolaricaulota bacterium]
MIEDRAFNDNQLTLVLMGDSVDIANNSFDGNFKEVYDIQKKTAGVYVRDNLYSDWYKQE